LTSIAAQAFPVPSRHEVARARSAGGLDEKLAVRANRLKPVMLDDHGFPRKQSKESRRQSRSRNVNGVGLADQIPQLNQRWPPHDTKRKQTIVKLARGGLRSQTNLEFRIAAGFAKPSEAPSQRQNDGLDSADARRKKMRVDK
jgi:hypothetical protein